MKIIPVTIVHSPTNRKFKGTELIISVIERTQKREEDQFFIVGEYSKIRITSAKK